MNKNKIAWNKPNVFSMDEEKTKETIISFACSNHEEWCRPAGAHIESFPGKPPVEIM